jgi:hypothetical protein
MFRWVRSLFLSEGISSDVFMENSVYGLGSQQNWTAKLIEFQFYWMHLISMIKFSKSHVFQMFP